MYLFPLVLDYDVSADGQRLMISAKEDGNAEAVPTNTTLVLVQNWFGDLKRLVPVPEAAVRRAF